MSDEHRIIRDVFRRIVNKDVRPRLNATNKIHVMLNLRLVQILDVVSIQ